jgi:hypothetical protein
MTTDDINIFPSATSSVAVVPALLRTLASSSGGMGSLGRGQGSGQCHTGIVRHIYRATTPSHWTELHPHRYFNWNLYNRMCPPSLSSSSKHGIYNVCFITGMISTHCATKPQNPIYTSDAGHKILKHDNRV